MLLCKGESTVLEMKIDMEGLKFETHPLLNVWHKGHFLYFWALFFLSLKKDNNNVFIVKIK